MVTVNYQVARIAMEELSSGRGTGKVFLRITCKPEQVKFITMAFHVFSPDITGRFCSTIVLYELNNMDQLEIAEACKNSFADGNRGKVRFSYQTEIVEKQG